MKKPNSQSRDTGKAGALARMYGVSSKTVRDIWLGRTWYRSTYSLDASKPPETERLAKKMGRPKGMKDSKPRSKKGVGNTCQIITVAAVFAEMGPAESERVAQSKESCSSAAYWSAARLYGSETVAAQAESHFAAWLASPIQVGGFQDPFRSDWASGFWTGEGLNEPKPYCLEEELLSV